MKATQKEIEIMEIGSKIKNARNEAGYTQERAAEALGISRQSISNWENGRSYPDIVSVIKMSDLYSVSLDHLLKEEEEMKDTYLGYLEESTNRVKSNNRLAKVIMIAVVVFVYAIAQYVFWTIPIGPMVSSYTIVFKYVLLPASVLLMTAIAGKGKWWGKGKWALVAIFSVLFLLVPSITYVSFDTGAYRTFIFPNVKYLFVGCAASLIGLLVGERVRNREK